MVEAPNVSTLPVMKGIAECAAKRASVVANANHKPVSAQPPSLTFVTAAARISTPKSTIVALAGKSAQRRTASAWEDNVSVLRGNRIVRAQIPASTSRAIRKIVVHAVLPARVTEVCALALSANVRRRAPTSAKRSTPALI
jgi:hypothetical protein